MTDGEAIRADVPAKQPPPGALREVAALFLKLGFTAFGGPAAHIAMMRQEVVGRRHWLTDSEFLDLFGAANLIPGPSSTEVAIFLGYRRAGWRGLIIGGVLFILPAMLLVLAFAWAYVHFGTTPQVGWLLYGVKPVIVAVILQALWNLGRTAVKSVLLAALGVAVLALYLVGVNVISLIFGAGLLVVLILNRERLGSLRLTHGLILLPAAGSVAAAAVPVSLTLLFVTFLKIGAVLYGSGYVLLAFLRTDLVENLHWLTDQQLLDAVAVGQFTPGPVFTTATFIGYVVAGLPGAILATVAIFLPGFIFVALIFPIVPRLRRSPWTSAFLDGVNVAAIGLMAGVTLQIAQAALVDAVTVAIAVAAALILIRFKLNSAWLVLAGGIVGVASHLVVG